MKNLKKKLATIFLATVLAVSLTACGQKELSPSEARDELRENEMASVIPLSEAFSEEGIWFFKDTYDRDKTITKDDLVQDGILYFDGNGNATYYDFTNASDKPAFADLNDLSDEEIIKMAEELSSETGTTPITAKFELHVKTDGTGNNTESEKLVVGDKTFNFDTALSNQVVFDSTYSGMVMMDSSWFDNCLVRKVEEWHSGFRMDSPDTKGIEVD